MKQKKFFIQISKMLVLVLIMQCNIFITTKREVSAYDNTNIFGKKNSIRTFIAPSNNGKDYNLENVPRHKINRNINKPIKKVKISEDNSSILITGNVKGKDFELEGKIGKFVEFDDALFSQLHDKKLNFESIFMGIASKESDSIISIFDEKSGYDYSLHLYLKDLDTNDIIFIEIDLSKIINSNDIEKYIANSNECIEYSDVFWLPKILKPAKMEEEVLKNGDNIDFPMQRSGEKLKTADKTYNIYYNLGAAKYKEVLVVSHILKSPSRNGGDIHGIVRVKMAFTFDVKKNKKYSESTVSRIGGKKMETTLGVNSPYKFTKYTVGEAATTGGNVKVGFDLFNASISWKGFSAGASVSWTKQSSSVTGTISVVNDNTRSIKTKKRGSSYLLNEGNQFNTIGTVVLNSGTGAGYSSIYAGFKYDIYCNANSSSSIKTVEMKDSIYRTK